MILDLKRNIYIKKSRIREITNILENNYNIRYKYLKIRVLTDEELLKINNIIHQKNYYTDVISININRDLKKIEGELYVSIDRVRENERVYNTIGELERVIIHGLLHLKGSDDKTESEKRKMTVEENAVLKELNVSRET